MTVKTLAVLWAVVVGGLGLAGAPFAAAEPAQNSSAAEQACSQFAGSVDLAAENYSEFADATSGDQWSYRDPMVTDTNVTGRTALRKAASAALNASATPGLPMEIARSMRKWSVQAMKLVVVMGVHGNDDIIKRGGVRTQR